MHAMIPRLKQTAFPGLRRERLQTLQVNLGYRCNQACLHCHVNAGPSRREQMDGRTMDQVLGYLAHSSVQTLDITGGAPELNPAFRDLVVRARAMGRHVIDRCNLTILHESGQEDLAAFLAENRVEIVASLPCYLEENVDGQRGEGVFTASIRALRRLNALGYGQQGTGLELSLVYNPTGPHLPPPQCRLESDYREQLGRNHGIVFNRLYTIANMPIARFGSTLVSRGEFDRYMALLHDAHRDENVAQVMCRTLISVDYRGYLYDCDFNQMLGMGIGGGRAGRLHISELRDRSPEGWSIMVADHCYGCTAGQGSSCGGAL